VKEKKGFFLALLILFLVSFIIFQVIASDGLVTVTVNGEGRKVAQDLPLEQLLKEMDFKPTPGDFLDIDGRVIRKEGGEEPLLTVNGNPASGAIQLQDKDQIVAKNGANLQEEIVEKKIVVPFSLVEKGQGPAQKIVQQGEPGLKIVSRGAVSGKLVAVQTLKEPVDKVIIHYTPESNPENRESGFLQPIRKIGRGEKVVALTFDDGPGFYTSQVLDILARYHVKATFFMIGLMVDQHPEQAKMVAEAGHAIGNHTMHHRNLTAVSAEEMVAEIKEAAQIIQKTTGVETNVFRPPGGRYNTTALNIVKQAGYQLMMWSIDPRDWDHAGALQIEQHVLEQAQSGSIILLHDGGGNRQETLKALPGIIVNLQQRGYTFVTL